MVARCGRVRLAGLQSRIKKINGRLFPFGFMRLLRGRKKIRRIRCSVPMFCRNSTDGAWVWWSWRGLVPDALKWGIQEAEFSWVLESNNLSYKSLKRGGAKLTKTYRIYDYPAPESE